MKGGAINNKILFSVLIVVIILVCAAVVVLHFKSSAQASIENLQALYITSSDATLKAGYKFENRWSDAKIRFEYKMENSLDNWDSTDWREASENGIVYEDIHDLKPTARYEFKATIEHDSEEISSSVYSFETYTIPLTFEAYGTVDYTIDGDTVRVNLTWVNPSTVGVSAPSTQSVRFSGGVDAPELHLPTGPPDEGAEEAKSFVRDHFCPYKAEVFLDLDNKSDTPYHDINGRLLGVIYVKENGKWINVNAEVLRWGLKAYPDHDWFKYSYFSTEFNSQQWLENDYPYVLENFV
jgi:endonuclease YncB( thermonuclease family)